jgi:hypothetical protein
MPCVASPAGNVIPALDNGEKADAPAWHTSRVTIFGTQSAEAS